MASVDSVPLPPRGTAAYLSHLHHNRCISEKVGAAVINAQNRVQILFGALSGYKTREQLSICFWYDFILKSARALRALRTNKSI